MQAVDYLAEHEIKIERPAMCEALRHLALRDILSGGADPDPTLGQAYRWQLTHLRAGVNRATPRLAQWRMRMALV